MNNFPFLPGNNLGLNNNGGVVDLNNSAQQNFGNYHVNTFNPYSVDLAGNLNHLGNSTGITVDRNGFAFDANGHHVGGFKKI